MKKKLIAAVILVIAIAAVLFINSINSKNVATDNSSINLNNSANDHPDWKTFTSEKYGFSIKYPTKYSISSTDDPKDNYFDAIVTVENNNPSPNSKDASPKFFVSLDTIVTDIMEKVPDYVDVSLPTFKQLMLDSQRPAAPQISDVNETKINGFRTFVLDYADEGEGSLSIRTYFIIKNSKEAKAITIIPADYSVFEEIAKTFTYVK